MDINVNYEGYSQVMSDLGESYCNLNEEWSRASFTIANELSGFKSSSAAFDSFATQTYNYSVLVGEYYNLISANFNAIHEAVLEFMSHDETTASSISGN